LFFGVKFNLLWIVTLGDTAIKSPRGELDLSRVCLLLSDKLSPPLYEIGSNIDDGVENSD
jgi:hypothetical protein